MVSLAHMQRLHMILDGTAVRRRKRAKGTVVPFDFQMNSVHVTIKFRRSYRCVGTVWTRVALLLQVDHLDMRSEISGIRKGLLADVALVRVFL